MTFPLPLINQSLLNLSMTLWYWSRTPRCLSCFIETKHVCPPSLAQVHPLQFLCKALDTSIKQVSSQQIFGLPPLVLDLLCYLHSNYHIGFPTLKELTSLYHQLQKLPSTATMINPHVTITFPLLDLHILLYWFQIGGELSSISGFIKTYSCFWDIRWKPNVGNQCYRRMLVFKTHINEISFQWIVKQILCLIILLPTRTTW